MSVNRIQINKNLSGGTISIKIPIGGKYSQVGQSDLIEEQFVKKAVMESINPIVDFEKVRFSPIDESDVLLDFIEFEIHTRLGDTYGDNGFVYDDFYYKRNNVKMSFLNLNFYNDKYPTSSDFLFETDSYFNFNNTIINSSLVDNQMSIKLEDAITSPLGFSEGFYVYYEKEKVSDSEVELFINFRFNNAKTGESNRLMCSSTQLTSGEDVIRAIPLMVKLKKHDGKYVYKFATNSYGNIYYNNGGVTVKLYEIDVI